MKISIYPHGPINAVMYVVEGEDASYIIDPCVSLSEITTGVSPFEGILITHCHYDHINRMEEIRNTLSVDVYAHPLEFPSFRDPDRSGASFFMSEEIFDLPDRKCSHGDTFNVGKGIRLEVMETPGHTKGSISFLLIENDVTKAIFAGDTIFKGSAGRTDLGGDPVILDRSLAAIAGLGDDVIIYSGHGDMTTVGEEKRNNPFVVRALRKRENERNSGNFF